MPDKAILPAGQIVNWDESKADTVYSNIMGFGMSPFDIVLTFGLIGSATVQEVNAIAKVKIVVSPEQAKNLALLLGVAVETYVSNNGPLRSGGAVDLDVVQKQVATMQIKNEG